MGQWACVEFFRISAPILVGAVLAWLLDPIVTCIEKKFCYLCKKKLGYSSKCRIFAVVLTIMAVVGVVLALGIFFFYSISRQVAETGVTGFGNLIGRYFANFQSSLGEIDKILESFHLGSNVLTGGLRELQRSSLDNLNGAVSGLVDQTVNFSTHLAKFGLGFVLSIYFLIDKNMFILYGNVLGRILLRKKMYRWLRSWYHDADRIFSGYVRGQTADVLFMAVSISILLTLVGIKYGALIGCIAGICNYIPYFGPMVAYVGTISFGLLNGQEQQVFIAIILLFILQQIDGSFIGPKLMGRNIAIQPVFLLMGVIIGGSIFGFIGMLLAVPVTALMKLIFVRFLEKRLTKLESFHKE